MAGVEVGTVKVNGYTTRNVMSFACEFLVFVLTHRCGTRSCLPKSVIMIEARAGCCRREECFRASFRVILCDKAGFLGWDGTHV
jgi:hypothetical protein